MTYFGDKAPNVTATVVILAVLAYIVYGLRVYTRLRAKAWGMDDWCMTAATVSFPITEPNIALMTTVAFHCVDDSMSRGFLQRHWNPQIQIVGR